MTKDINVLLPQERIVNQIFVIRGKKVMIDRDLGELYGVETRALIQAVKRNLERFPDDFMCQLTWEEARDIRSQNVILNEEISQSRSQNVTSKRGLNIKYRPYAFSEHGVLMLSSVLKSERAIQVNIQIVRTFAKLREMLASHTELRQKIEDMESRYDKQFKVVFDALRKLLTEEEKPKRQIGFHPN